MTTSKPPLRERWQMHVFSARFRELEERLKVQTRGLASLQQDWHTNSEGGV